MTNHLHNLTESLGILGRGSRISMTQRQKIRDQLFKKIGQAALLDAVATQTEVEGLVMPLSQIRNIFQPRKVALGLPAMMALVFVAVFGSVATGALAKDATAGDSLFIVRKALEAVQIALTPDPVAKAEVRLSIATDRVNDVLAGGVIAGPQLDNVLTESSKAIESAKVAVVGLEQNDEGSAESLAEKLSQVIASQREILDEIVAGSTDEAARDNAIAMIGLLDQATLETDALTEGSDQATEEAGVEEENTIQKPKEDTAIILNPIQNIDSLVNLTGTLTTVLGNPALNVGATTYSLIFATPINLTRHFGATGVVVYGRLTEKGIEVYSINIDNTLIGEWVPQGGPVSNKNDNQSSAVDSV